MDALVARIAARPNSPTRALLTAMTVEHALRALQGQIALNKLTQAQKTQELAGVGTALRAAGVTVSPRYGRFDAQSLTIVDSQPNWLVPGPSPSPTATATP